MKTPKLVRPRNLCATPYKAEIATDGHKADARLRAGVKGATALSQAVIAGGALAGVGVTLHKKHPYDPSRPLIDFDLALMLLPVILLGVSVGALPHETPQMIGYIAAFLPVISCAGVQTNPSMSQEGHEL
jgi:hypothetical protein